MGNFFGLFFIFPPNNQTLEEIPLKITEVQIQEGSTSSSHAIEAVMDLSNALQRNCSII